MQSNPRTAGGHDAGVTNDPHECATYDFVAKRLARHTGKKRLSVIRVQKPSSLCRVGSQTVRNRRMEHHDPRFSELGVMNGQLRRVRIKMRIFGL
jgi:hypothetical protein